MVQIGDSVSSKFLNQHPSQVIKRVREEHDIVPVTYGRDAEVVAYIVPADAVRDGSGLTVLRSRGPSQARTKSGRSLRERFHPVRLGPGRNAADTLQQMRDEETR